MDRKLPVWVTTALTRAGLLFPAWITVSAEGLVAQPRSPSSHSHAVVRATDSHNSSSML
jgi:hypothetical protein